MIQLYGNDHSPWVQAVMLGIHQKQLPNTRTTVPPWEAFSQWGVMMPAASIDGRPWQLQSKDILQDIGFSEVSKEDMALVQATWQGVLHRCDNWVRFWGEFSLAGDPNPNTMIRLVNNFLRSFSILYFFLLINFAVFTGRREIPRSYVDPYRVWEDRFNSLGTPFLGGEEPDSLDLLLFGIVQCHSSIPVPTLAELQSDPELTGTRRWIAEMQRHFADYDSLYSVRYFEPHREPRPAADVLDQLAFWAGAAFMIYYWWITVPLVAILAYRNRAQR